MARRLWLIPGLLILAALAATGCGNSTDDEAATTPAPATPNPAPAPPPSAYDRALAAPPAPPTPSAYDDALAALDRKCEEGPSLIADYITKAQELLTVSGINESPSSIATHVNRSLPESLPVTQCSDVFAAYVTLLQGPGG